MEKHQIAMVLLENYRRSKMNARSPARPTAAGRWIAYWVFGCGLILGYVLLRDASWQGSSHLHTTMEILATFLAVMVTVMALARFYSRRKNSFLLLGAGFAGTALLDGYHTVITTKFLAPYLPSILPALIPWSSFASRLFLSVMMIMVALVCVVEQRYGEREWVREKVAFLSITAFAAVSFLCLALVPLPRAYHPEFFFHRTAEIVPAVFFLLALIGILRIGKWRSVPFDHWLVMSLIDIRLLW